jgi:hypothetical protein
MRIYPAAVFVLLSAIGLRGQGNPMIGTWKLNLAKSTFSPGPAPTSQTTTIEIVGEGIKHTTAGVAADGSAIGYSYTTTVDGKYEPIQGKGPSGADRIAVKHIDRSTTEATYKKDGKVVQTSRTVVSKDGSVRTVTSDGVNQRGQATHTVTVYDRQ